MFVGVLCYKYEEILTTTTDTDNTPGLIFTKKISASLAKAVGLYVFQSTFQVCLLSFVDRTNSQSGDMQRPRSTRANLAKVMHGERKLRVEFRRVAGKR